MLLRSLDACGRLLLQMQAPSSDARSQLTHAEELEEQATELLSGIMLGDDVADDVALVFWDFGRAALTLARERIKQLTTTEEAAG